MQTDRLSLISPRLLESALPMNMWQHVKRGSHYVTLGFCSIERCRKNMLVSEDNKALLITDSAGNFKVVFEGYTMIDDKVIAPVSIQTEGKTYNFEQ